MEEEEELDVTYTSSLATWYTLSGCGWVEVAFIGLRKLKVYLIGGICRLMKVKFLMEFFGIF